MTLDLLLGLYLFTDVPEEAVQLMSTDELMHHRREKLEEKKVHIATLASAILADPEISVCGLYFEIQDKICNNYLNFFSSLPKHLANIY